MEFEITISNAQLIYTASTVLIGLSLVVLNYAWKALEKMLSSLPEGEQRVRFNLKSIEDEREKFKADIIILHFFGCVAFAITIATCTLTILSVSSIMLGFNFGGHQEQNYQAGRTLLSVGIVLFVTGLWWISPVYISRTVSAIKGKPDILTTDLTTLKPMPAEVVAKSKAFDKWVFFFIIVLLALFLLGIFQVWVSILITVGVFTIAYFVTKLIEKCRFRSLK
ncbi:MAG: hypothetical protein PHO26_02000 [Dehalococcoidia bacterium]|nr:hypothetical protein [Dehalococcoidia bacterium]